MSANSFGRRFVVVCFGESHGEAIGVIIDGCPAGLPISEGEVQEFLDKRKPKSTVYSTMREEEDRVKIISGIFKGRTTGAPICMMVANKDVDSSPYEVFRKMPRPGHADYFAALRYGGFNDYRGGGRFSGRVTVALVAAGAIAKKLLQASLGIEIYAHVLRIGKVKANREPSIDELRKVYDNALRCAIPEVINAMEEELRKAIEDGDSLGSEIEAYAFNIPAGLGDPLFHGLDVDLAAIMFAVPGVRAVGFGAGFEASRMRGSEYIDEYRFGDGKVYTVTNRSGGILGGLSTGMPIRLNVAFKPVSTIAKAVKTVDLEQSRQVELKAYGRYDPCIGPRATPVVEACLSLVLVDHCINQGIVPVVLK